MEQHDELNLTPYLDILMNLIVFVMLSGVAALGQIPVTVSGPSASGAGNSHTLRIAHDGFLLDGDRVADLRAGLSALGPHSRRLTLSAEADVTLDALVQAMDTARAEHFDEVTLSD